MSEADHERGLAARREAYENLTGFEFNALLLRRRRTKALARRRARQEKDADREVNEIAAGVLDSDYLADGFAKIAQIFETRDD